MGFRCPKKGTQHPRILARVLWTNDCMDQDATWYGVNRGPGHTLLHGDPAPLPLKGAQRPPIFGPCLSWPNGWMDQDAIWYRGRRRLRRHCVRRGPSSPLERHSPNFRPMSVCPVCDVGVLWPNGWMEQDETWHGGRPRPRRHCVRWGPALPPEWGTAAPLFSAHV